MRFTKMHGLGNDFIVIDAVEKEYFPTPNDARRRLVFLHRPMHHGQSRRE